MCIIYLFSYFRFAYLLYCIILLHIFPFIMFILIIPNLIFHSPSLHYTATQTVPLLYQLPIYYYTSDVRTFQIGTYPP